MFFMITNIYNKKTDWPTLMATGKLKKISLTTRDVRCVHHGWHSTHHRYNIQVLATYASTWVHRYSSMLQWSVPKGTDHCGIVINFCNHGEHYETPRIVEPDRPQMTIWRTGITCWILKTTNTNKEYVILIAFPQQQWLQDRASLLRCI
jgi:hypothetical protein